jgi:hypothetical protein
MTPAGMRAAGATLPSLRGFVSHLRERAWIVARGETPADIARLAAWALLRSTPRTVLRILPALKTPLNALADRLIDGAVISLMGCRFRLVDSESIAILRPEFEQWMWRYLRLPRGGVFIDVGAHIGKYTIPAAKMVGSSGLVIALEPHPRN